MVEEEKAIHEQCTQHPLKCKTIADIEGSLERSHNEHVRIWEHMSRYLKSKVFYAAMTGLGIILTGLFGYLINLNTNAIEGSIERHKAQQQAVSKFADIQQDVRISVTAIEGTLQEVQNDVEDLKEDVRELH